MSVTIFRARYVATMTGPLLGDTSVFVRDGRVVSVVPTGVTSTVGDRVGDVGRKRSSSSVLPEVGAEVVDIDGVLLPGLVNAHTHLDLTNSPRPQKVSSFTDWLLHLLRERQSKAPLTADERANRVVEAVEEGVRQSLRFGVTFVGDITPNVRVVRPVLARAGIRSVSFGECLGIGPRRARFDELVNIAVEQQKCSGLMRTGISPHAPYTVDREGYATVAKVAKELAMPVTTHLAETPDEDDFVRHGGGAFGRFYQELGLEVPKINNGSQTELTSAVETVAGVANRNWLLAHMNYVDDAGIAAVVKSGASVVWCPRTHQYFGHPPHPWRKLVDAGVNVCVGTDSCASSPNLNLVDDLRLVRQQNPTMSADEIWALATVNAGRALHNHDEKDANDRPGTIAPGRPADFCVFSTLSDRPLDEILTKPDLLPTSVWINGARRDI